LVILRSRSRDETELQQVAIAASLAVTPKLSRRLQYLPILGSVAIMLGAIGALWGVRVSLLAAGPAPDHAQRLSAGLAAAVIPPVPGLFVAGLFGLRRGFLRGLAEAVTEPACQVSVPSTHSTHH